VTSLFRTLRISLPPALYQKAYRGWGKMLRQVVITSARAAARFQIHE